MQGDVFSRAGIEAVAKEAKEKLGGVDIVISNAGWTKIAPWNDIREYPVVTSCLPRRNTWWRKTARHLPKVRADAQAQ